MDPYHLSSYHYDLPQELIARYPIHPRDASRLLVVDRKSGKIFEKPFKYLLELMQPGDNLVFNDTKVVPTRLMGRKSTGAQIEIFLLKQQHEGVWTALAKPGKKIPKGSTVIFGDDFSCQVLETLENGSKIVKFLYEGHFEAFQRKYGQIPIPHYMQRDAEASDETTYQTVYADKPGAAAAPTAGLHFSHQLLQELEKKEVSKTVITLHVGVGTFKPVTVEDLRHHKMHEETFIIEPEAALQLNNFNREHRQICVGTTTCRALESAADQNGVIHPGTYDTNIFIYPGYRFKYVHHLLTNFHLPKSTLLMLVSAFGGHELIMEAYAKAVENRFRFFSYGDAMLIL